MIKRIVTLGLLVSFIFFPQLLLSSAQQTEDITLLKPETESGKLLMQAIFKGI